MIYLLEGPDGAGKTTLAKQLKKILKNAEIIHATYSKNLDIEQYHHEIANEAVRLTQEGKHVILDRHYLSEWIYGHIFRDGHYGLEVGTVLDFHMSGFGLRRIMCLPEKETVLNNFKKRKKDEMFNSVSEVYDEYKDFYMQRSHEWIKYDYEKDTPESLLIETNKYVSDVKAFLDKMGMERLQAPGIHPMIQVRVDHLQEELSELQENLEEKDLEEIIDALVDLVYIAIGTAILCGFNFDPHWDEVQRANITKERGVTKRGHNFDAKKPDDWKGPDHTTILEENYGL